MIFNISRMKKGCEEGGEKLRAACKGFISVNMKNLSRL
jgi:hypothetical protein